MISYALNCDKGHGFDSWFRDSSAFDEQQTRGLLSCPRCGSVKIDKAVMAPRVARRGGSQSEAGLEAAPEGAQPVALVSPEEVALRAKIKELHAELTKNSDYVGQRFAEEARKMHFGDADHRSIHGEASAEDAKALTEEGIEFHALPTLPDDRN